MVPVQTQSKAADTIRSKPASYYEPKQRQQRVETHIHHYHYSHDPYWYGSQPYYHVGGGYSSMFWYMMMEWSAERRAQWLYHNQDRIEADAYRRGLQDAKVAALVRDLEAKKVARDADYVDSEFAENPGDMYDQEYVQTVVNHDPINQAPTGGMVILRNLLIVISVLGLICGGIWFLTNVRFGK